jgi:hypothetical protein
MLSEKARYGPNQPINLSTNQLNQLINQSTNKLNQLHVHPETAAMDIELDQ